MIKEHKFKGSKKFNIFLNVASVLNKSYGVTPILYGSFGLSRQINGITKVNDIDILLPRFFLEEKWKQLIDIMAGFSFQLYNPREHEFIGRGETVAFAPETDLTKLAKINPNRLKITRIGKIKFKELSVRQYLTVYEVLKKDTYRQNKSGKARADKKKITLIKKYLQKLSNRSRC